MLRTSSAAAIRRALRPGFRFLGTAVLLFSLVEVLGGSSCSFSSCTGCDDDWDDDDFDDDDWDDDDFDDDDGSSSSFGFGAPSDASAVVDWQLRRYRRVPSSEPGRHPLRSLIDIRDFSLSSKLGPGVFGDAELRAFTERVLAGNDALFALPEAAGIVRFDAIDHEHDFVVVAYVQERRDLEGGAATLVPDARLDFVLDLRGRLIRIDDTLRIE